MHERAVAEVRADLPERVLLWLREDQVVPARARLEEMTSTSIVSPSSEAQMTCL